MQYIVADTVAQAVALIGDGGVVLAGGTTVVPRLDEEVPSRIVDISKIGDLRAVHDSEQVIQIGAAVTLERAAEALSPHPSLRAVRAALQAIGNPHIRRLATLGGNLCADDQVRDLTTALVALDARVTVADRDGMQDMAVDTFLASIAPGAWLLTTVTIPIDPDRRSSFQKFAWRLASAPAVLNVAASARIVNGRLSEVRIAVGGTAKTPTRIKSAEASLEGHGLDATKIAEAAAECARATPIDSPAFTTTEYVRSALPQVVHDVISELLAGSQ